MAEQLAEGLAGTGGPLRQQVAEGLRDLGAVDLAVYSAVADTPTPSLDEPLRRLSNAANNSGLWFAIAAALALAGGGAGRRAALRGTLAIGATSALVNLAVKSIWARQRPDRAGVGVPVWRNVRMPTSTSFPSGHAASGFAFAAAIGRDQPWLGIAVRFLAAAVGYSRVHTGVHYPGDVVVGSLIGEGTGQAVAGLVDRLQPPRNPASSSSDQPREQPRMPRIRKAHKLSPGGSNIRLVPRSWSRRSGGAEQAIGVVHRPAADQRQRGLLRRQVVDRAVKQVSTEPHDVGECAGGQDPDVAILAEEPASCRGIELDGRVGVHPVLRALNSHRARAAGDQSPDGQQRVEEADVAVAAGRDQRPLVDPGPDRHDLAGPVRTPVPHQVAAQRVQQRMLDGDPDAQPHRPGAVCASARKACSMTSVPGGRPGCRSATCS